MSDISQDKAVARKAAFAARKAAHGASLDAAANARLIAACAGYPDAQIIAGYMPIRTEVSPLPAMSSLHAQGKIICVPVVLGDGQPLEFQVWTPEAEMREGAFGAKIPTKRQVVDPDLIITPLVAFDADCYRLGYGGGFYDRSFERLSTGRSVIGIGFAYGAQRLDAVPREPTDHQLQAIVTEAITFRA